MAMSAGSEKKRTNLLPRKSVLAAFGEADFRFQIADFGFRILFSQSAFQIINRLRKNPQTGHCERSEAISLLISLLKISISYQIASSPRHGGTPRNDVEELFPHPVKVPAPLVFRAEECPPRSIPGPGNSRRASPPAEEGWASDLHPCASGLITLPAGCHPCG